MGIPDHYPQGFVCGAIQIEICDVGPESHDSRNLELVQTKHTGDYGVFVLFKYASLSALLGS